MHTFIYMRKYLGQLSREKAKMKDGKMTRKTRLVARGCEENSEDLVTYSPTCQKDSFRLVLVIIASKGWDLNSLDVRAAFLQGQPLERDIYLRPPKQAKCKDTLWKLQKAVYGLDYASRYWYMRVKD